MRMCVFAGARSGNHPSYTQSARKLGTLLATHGIGLVYGGACVGVMGALAEAALERGGEVIGVIPRHGGWLAEENHTRLTTCHYVSGMHERKAVMSRLADGYIALPGGYGTFDELFEAIAWAQLGLHDKPIGVLNVLGFFDVFHVFVQQVQKAGFIASLHMPEVLMHEQEAMLLAAMMDAIRSRGMVRVSCCLEC